MRQEVNLAWGSTAPAATRDSGWDAAVQSAQVRSYLVTEIHLCARPGLRSGGLEAQARSMYWNLLAEMHALGVGPLDIVTEKIFLSDVDVQAPVLQRVRHEFHGSHRGPLEPMPALTLVQQPPARPGQLCEVLVFVLIPEEGRSLVSRGMDGLPPGCSGRIVEAGGLRHCFLSGVSGESPEGASGFARQADAMFAAGELGLEREGFSFSDVVRTWIYLRDVGAHYGEMNASRREFFLSRGVSPPPASTGIQGAPPGPGRLCSLDLVAVAGGGRLEVRPIHARTLNEAPAYGADFSRGMRVAFEDRAVIYVSGTASINAAGRIVAPADIVGQVDRMLLNVKALLAGHGAMFGDIVSAVTYLKKPEYLEAIRSGCRLRGLPERIPNTICIADICRPEWLCEMEAIAVLT